MLKINQQMKREPTKPTKVISLHSLSEEFSINIIKTMRFLLLFLWLMTVQPTSPVSPTRSLTSTPAASVGGSQVVITVIIGVVVLLLLLLGLHKRFSHSRNTRSGAAAEDYVNGEMQEQIQKLDSANTASFPKFPISPSASLLYSTVVFRVTSNAGGAEATLGLKPSSSAHQHSTVMYM